MATKWIFNILKVHVSNIVAAAQLENTHREIRELEQTGESS